MPRVSIGMPVHNGEKTLGASINALLLQTYRDFDIIISDNNSTDATAIICAQYAEKDARIRYIKQGKNLGVGGNLQFTLRNVNSDYFCWNAHDDIRSTNFLEKNIAFLEANKLFSGSASPNCFDGEESDENTWRKWSLEGAIYERLQTFLNYRWQSQGIFYGLFRTKQLQVAMSKMYGMHPFAADWIIILYLLMYGPIKRIDEGLFISGRGGASESPGRISNFQYNIIDRLFPLVRFGTSSAREILRSTELSHYDKARLIYRLCHINWEFRLRSG
jgi:glycosyltransferase involved in cell wall biosynthesis